ncbi:MAG: phenylpropionate dioxygenase-like ring-hydroxylating dioxygenase large terminal subunit [Cryomorphaceae bacterium]|jgi:phenylpropionate dioxygenase-like ring-hydroxylating dioxygenase large terminal subunit
MPRILDDHAVIAQLLTHIENGTTDEADGVWRESVLNYTSPQRFMLERETLLKRWPVVFCPSSALPEPGSYLAREAAGVPLLATRDKDGLVRVFKNACRHRGMKVAENSGRTNTFVCPYHGWVYRLDGELINITHEAGFPDVDKSCNGLVSVEAREKDGLVYVVQDPTSNCWEPLKDVPKLIRDDQIVLDEGEYFIDANWKIFAESFLEGYHIKPAHKNTFYPYGYDNINLVELFGRNGRITFPFRRIEKLVDVPSDQWQLDGRVTQVSNLFPNVMLATLSHFTSIVVLEPVTVSKTLVRTWTLSNRGAADTPQAKAEVKRDLDFNAIGLREDRDMVESIQKGLACDANSHLTFGKYEKLISHLHRNLEQVLGGVMAD